MKMLSRLFVLAVVLTLGVLTGCGDNTPPYTGPALPYTPEPPKAKEPNPKVELVTDQGTIEVELFEDDAPNTVNNFVELVEKKFYDGLTFHRIMKDFMIQGGCPQGTGSSGPGYKIKDEVRGRTNNKHVQYALSMAKEPAPNTGGSQFFIVSGKNGAHHLDNAHTVFGKVTKGQEAVDKLNLTQVAGERPILSPKIISMKVLSKRNHEYKVKDTIVDPLQTPPPAPAKKEEAKKDEPKKDEAKKEEPKK